jgi:hypothetical protein
MEKSVLVSRRALGGDDMSGKLPMNPWLYIFLIVALLGIQVWGMGTDHMGWADASVLTALSLQIFWIWQAGLYTFSKLRQMPDVAATVGSRKRWIVGALIALVISALNLFVGFHFFADPQTGTIPWPAAFPVMLFVLLGLASALTLIFQISKALCQAEEKPTGERIFVTCLLMVYLLIGAPFLYRRLKRLDPAEA